MRAFYHGVPRQVAFRMALLLALAALAPGCGASAPATSTPAPATATSPSAPSANPIVRYLRGAELQAEDEAQVANIHRAFEDLVALPTAELRARRYADYQGTPGAWDLPRVIRSHFVPESRENAGIVDDPDAFWAAADSDEVRALAREMLRALDAPARANPPLAP